MEGHIFEFNEKQNLIIKKLFRHMTFVAYSIIALGGVIGIYELYKLIVIGFDIPILFSLVAVVVLITMGAVTMRSANHFKKITKTHGDDIGNLIIALDKLTTWFSIITAMLSLAIGALILIIIYIQFFN